jgi:hypothetical protein
MSLNKRHVTEATEVVAALRRGRPLAHAQTSAGLDTLVLKVLPSTALMKWSSL